MLRAIKKVVFWTYTRGSWQYDILCIVILCFIFLTPKAVFDGAAFSDEELQIEQKQAPISVPTSDSESDSEEDVETLDPR